MKNPNKKEIKMKKFTKRHRWEIVRLPNGDFRWVVRRGI